MNLFKVILLTSILNEGFCLTRPTDTNLLDIGSTRLRASLTSINNVHAELHEENSLVTIEQSTETELSVCRTRKDDTQDNSVLIFYKRLISSLLQQMGLTKNQFTSEGSLTIKLIGEISLHSYETLFSFINSHPNDTKLYLDQVDNILSKLLFLGEECDEIPIFQKMYEKLNVKILLSAATIGILTFLGMILILQICANRNSIWKFCAYSCLLIILISSIWVALKNYDEEEAKKMSYTVQSGDTLPRDCFLSEFGFFESLEYFIRVRTYGNDECEIYHKKLGGDSFYKISPIEVVTETLAKGVFSSLGYIGEKFGDFFYSFINAFPSLSKIYIIVLFPILIVGAVFLKGFRISTLFFEIDTRSPPSLPSHQQNTSSLQNTTANSINPAPEKLSLESNTNSNVNTKVTQVQKSSSDTTSSTNLQKLNVSKKCNQATDMEDFDEYLREFEVTSTTSNSCISSEQSVICTSTSTIYSYMDFPVAEDIEIEEHFTQDSPLR